MLKFYTQLSVNKQLVVSNAVTFTLVIFAAIAALLSVQSVRNTQATADVFGNAQYSLQVALRGVNESILTEGSSASVDLTRKGMADFETALGAIPPLLAGDAAKLAAAERIAAQWKELAAQITPFLSNKDLSVEDGDTMIAFGRIIGASSDLLNDMDGLADDIRAQGGASTRSVIGVMLGAFCLILVCILLVGYIVFGTVTRPLQAAVKVAKSMAAGDLTQQIEVASGLETGQLLQALKDTNESLKQIVGEVRHGTEAVSAASREIAAGNADLSSRTEAQAASLEETASSMEELTSTVRHNAENARQANQLASGASDVAVKGGQVVHQVVATMSSINDSSKKIADIISVIDGIAFQTNILALNAAVEAARAGEQGRGFAVVASEVRTLAQRSAGAAKEIKELIDDSVAKVSDGTRLVDEAGRTMDEIVSAVKRVTDVMAEITSASAEQSAGIEQINQAVAQMDMATQQNAALVEEAAASAETMEKQAQNLAHAVSVFKLDEYATHAHASSNPPAARTGLPRKSAARSVASKKPAPRLIAKSDQDGEWAAY
jgi:methyl-accepting chemotaxis protein